MDKFNLSPYGRASVTPSPVNRMMASFADDFREGVDINLGVGYVNENTIPRAFIEEALHEVIYNQEKHRCALNYGGPQGSQNLINSIKNFLITNHFGGLTQPVLDRQQILIAPSGATSILEGMAHIFQRGIVITSDPIYYIYSNVLERMGFEILAIPEDDDGLNTDILEEQLIQLKDRINDIAFIYVVTVNNPTCAILSNARQEKLVEIAARLSRQLDRKVPLFLDKAYENLIHDPDVPPRVSALLDEPAQIAYEIYTLSKIIAPALRIGYLIGPDSDFTRAMIQKTSDVGFSAPLIMQEIAGHILDFHALQQIDKVNQGYRQKARQTRQWIDELLGDFLTHISGGSGGFYFYLTFDHIPTHEESDFFKFLTRNTGHLEADGPPDNKHPRVIYIPGRHCVHSRGRLTKISQCQLRLSYGYEELDKIHQALQFIRQAVLYVRNNKVLINP